MLPADIYPLLLAATDAYTTAYWGALIIGGGLLAFSMLGVLGHAAGVDADVHGDADVGADFHADSDFSTDADVHVDTDVPADADIHADVDAAHVAHAGAATSIGLSTWLSVRFIVFAAAVFGATGLILTHLSHTEPTVALGIALAAGIAVGQGVHQLFRAIRRRSGDSTPQISDYVNKLARVTIAINPPDPGEIALQVLGTRRYVPAVSLQTGAALSTGDEVVVVRYRDGVAQVVSRARFEQATRG